MSQISSIQFQNLVYTPTYILLLKKLGDLELFTGSEPMEGWALRWFCAGEFYTLKRPILIVNRSD